MKGKIMRSYLISTVSMALVLFILGTIGFAMLSLLKSSKQVREGVVMIVELKDGFSAEQRDSLQMKIADNRLVAAVDFVSKDEKLADEDFRRAFDIDIKDILSDNPLPDSFDVTLSSAAAPAVLRSKTAARTERRDTPAAGAGPHRAAHPEKM